MEILNHASLDPNFMIATINDPAGKIIGQMQMISDPKDYLLIGYNRKVWLIPQTAFQPNILPTRVPNPRLPNTQHQSQTYQTAKTSMTRHTYPSEQTHRARTTQSSQFPSLAETLRQTQDQSMTDRQQSRSTHPTVIDLTQDSETFSSQNNHMHAEVSRPAPIATQTKTPRTVRITGKKRVREDEKEETHASKRTKYDNLEWDKVAYWRINPDQTAELQLCDIEGNVLHTEAVRTKYGKRKLNRGYLNIRIDSKTHHLRRASSDNHDLQTSGFAEGAKATYQYILPKPTSEWQINTQEKSYPKDNDTIYYAETESDDDMASDSEDETESNDNMASDSEDDSELHIVE